MKEEFDYKRFFLINIKRIWIVILSMIVSAIIFGGVYYLKEFVFDGPDIYRSDAMYKITFDEEKYDATIAYYNDYTWNDVLDSDMVAGEVARLTGLSKEDIAKATSVPTMSDITIFHVYVDDTSKDQAVRIQDGIANALEKFPVNVPGFISIVQWDNNEPYVYHSSNHMGRVIVVGLAIGILFGVLIVCYISAMDDSVYTARDLNVKGIDKVILHAEGLKEYDNDDIKVQLTAMLDNAAKAKAIAIYPYDGAKRNDVIENILKDIEGIKLVVKSGEESDSYIRQIKEADFVLLIANFGQRDGRHIELSVNALKNMGGRVDAAVVTGCNARFIKNYYG